MNHRKFIILAMVLVVVIAGLGRLMIPAAGPSSKTVHASTSAKTTGPANTPLATKKISSPARPDAIASPSVNPVTPTAASPQVKSPPDVAPEPAPPEPTAELTTVISDAARLLRQGDYMAFVRDYTTPQKLADMSPEELASRQSMDHNPEIQPMLNMVAQVLETIKNQTPVMNAAGDRAVYMAGQTNGLDPQNIGPQPIVFVKVDGHWYKEPTVNIKIDGQWYLGKQALPQ